MPAKKISTATKEKPSLTREQSDLVVRIQAQIGLDKWFKLKELETLIQSGKSRSRMYKMMGDLEWRMRQVDHRYLLESTRGKGYCLMLRKKS